LHLINYHVYPDGTDIAPDENVGVRVVLPPETTVHAASALSPDWLGYQREVALTQDDGEVIVKLDKLATYAVIVLDLQNAGEGD